MEETFVFYAPAVTARPKTQVISAYAWKKGVENVIYIGKFWSTLSISFGFFFSFLFLVRLHDDHTYTIDHKADDTPQEYYATMQLQ